MVVRLLFRFKVNTRINIYFFLIKFYNIFELTCGFFIRKGTVVNHVPYLLQINDAIFPSVTVRLAKNIRIYCCEPSNVQNTISKYDLIRNTYFSLVIKSDLEQRKMNPIHLSMRNWIESDGRFISWLFTDSISDSDGSK